MPLEMSSAYYQPKISVEQQGIRNYTHAYYNPTTPELYELAVLRQEGLLAHLGPLVVRTGRYAGRTPRDKFIVREPSSQDKIWWGDINHPFDPANFDRLHRRLLAYLQGKQIHIQDCFVGADPDYRLPIRIITEMAWQSLFARSMFIQIHNPGILAQFEPEYTVISAPGYYAVPERDGTNSGTFILMHFGEKLILIGGTGYAGEIKKSVFTLMNYLTPQKDVLPMHCAANIGKDGASALFFGLSGTGKTALSSDPDRILVGDDEHGWSDNGIFNFEGGSYPKVLGLSPQSDPEIYHCVHRLGTVLENVTIDVHTRRIDFDDASLTENTRAAYALSCVENASETGLAPHPKNIIMLTADAFGVLPPVSRLTLEQAMYHFLSGYTAKVPGTEAGITEPQATFSACFGAPFMVLHPMAYASLLEERIRKHRSICWLVNTGWSGGPYGTGQRIKILYTRNMIRAALNGNLDQVEFEPEPYFGLSIPRECPDVPVEILNPINTWSDREAYERQAEDLRNRFRQNFARFASEVEPEVAGVL